jgi:hypothetical protein
VALRVAQVVRQLLLLVDGVEHVAPDAQHQHRLLDAVQHCSQNG